MVPGSAVREPGQAVVAGQSRQLERPVIPGLSGGRTSARARGRCRRVAPGDHDERVRIDSGDARKELGERGEGERESEGNQPCKGDAFGPFGGRLGQDGRRTGAAR